ncbi:ubiquitin carboxyl-terminal hydrolase 40-like [Chiloscyllium plagiosum]|uniref:ubiquitin carboxyl-terminal hydrolase 40-like n=1 Tax=Chiloscyllium plagiosum TaxID=36176 RepID=UPI001CB7F530|nr:ubiquitin carboxyl-terminal hydrolase 40-like [Chiloscyllium plagiosum]
MFGDMFEEEEDVGFVSENKTMNGWKSRKKDTDPPPHRAASNLSGIKNQGGTCYLNSLLQTLLYTPEFRESLFALGPEELGNLSDKDKPESKVRVIPLELQRLFAQLLLADQLAASTSDLTDSFGWTSNEETSQHDVQELNRILFSALESSLVGTSGHDLINRLYHGIVVNKIVCKECGNISERQEDFLDLTVAVKGVSGLEEALCTFYVEEEHFDNDNLYHCGRCEKLVKATKVSLPQHLKNIFDLEILINYAVYSKLCFNGTLDKPSALKHQASLKGCCFQCKICLLIATTSKQKDRYMFSLWHFKSRAEFDSATNNIEVHLHLGPEYKFRNGALYPASSQKDSMLTITIDRRKTIGDLRQTIFQLLEFWKGDMVISVAKQLPVGLHLYETFHEDHTSLHSLGITDGAILFVWNGSQVCGVVIHVGEEFEPMMLKILCPTLKSKSETEMVQFIEMQKVFTRNTLLASARNSLALSTGISPEELTVYYKKNLENKGSTNWIAYDAEDGHKTLADLRLKDGDTILVSDQKCCNLSVLSSNGMPITVADRSWLQVKNYCGEKFSQIAGKTVTIPVTMETLVSEIKANAIEKLKLKDEQVDGTCLRPIDRTGKLLPPVCEDLTVKGIGLKTGSSLALFPGHTPKGTQLFLYFSVGDSLHMTPEMEIVVEQNISVRECLKLMLEKAGLTGECWHLRKTDWCYDAGEVLKDEEATLAYMKITNGETLVIMEGRLPPKGFLMLPVWLYQPPLDSENRGCFREEQENIANRLCDLNIESTARDFSLRQYMGTELEYIGNIEISGEASLEDLKTQVLTLPLLQGLSVPSMEFLRVWLVENKCPVKILRNQQQQLSKFKLGSSAEIGIQLLQAEENLTSTELLLRLKMAVPGERMYYPAEEFVWDISKECTVRTLKQKIVQHYSLPPEQIEIAKYFPDQFEWMPMTSWTQQVSKKKKKKKQQSLHGAPYYLKDGDIIGVKNLLIDKNKDFSTVADDIGKEKLKLEGNSKDTRHQATVQGGDASENPEKQAVRARTRKPEVALSISVADFR